MSGDAVIEGLVLTLPSGERCRVMSASPAIRIERGSESTTPAAQPAGPVQVSGRLEVMTLADWKKEDRIVYELVSKDPHRLRSGGQIHLNGTWPTFRGTDYDPATGKGTQVSLNNGFAFVMVTGAERSASRSRAATPRRAGRSSRSTPP
jgi:hypothetical protein